MFDFAQKWTPATSGLAMSLPGIAVAAIPNLHLMLVSGNTAAGLARLAISSAPMGATAVAVDDSFALAVARDRCLAVSATPFSADEGWHAEGYALTDMTDGFTAVSLAGSGLRDLLAQATTYDWEAASRSAAISFAGLPAAAVFSRDRGRLWLFFEPSQTAQLQRWLAAAVPA